MKPANHRENRRDRCLTRNQNGKRKCVVVICEHGGEAPPAAFKSEDAAVSWIKACATIGTKLSADEAGSWNALYTDCSVVCSGAARQPNRLRGTLSVAAPAARK